LVTERLLLRLVRKVGLLMTTGLHLVFKFFQFIVLFWFIGRQGICWSIPGETGVGFKDYKGNPEVLESARQVVTPAERCETVQADGRAADSSSAPPVPARHGQEVPGQAIATEAQLRFGYMLGAEYPGHVLGHGYSARAQPLTKPASTAPASC
jgi:hypothetical protein